jgi:hypothetical protein
MRHEAPRTPRRTANSFARQFDGERILMRLAGAILRLFAAEIPFVFLDDQQRRRLILVAESL